MTTTPEHTTRCPSCGTPLIGGRCLTCDVRRLSSFVHREVVLLAVLVAITVAAFVGTRVVARGNDDLRGRQAAAWFEAGQQAIRSGQGDTAVVALRRAVTKDAGNRQYRLALARALTASHQDDEARRGLLALRESQPEDPETNLQLARLEARGADADTARRYYQSALAGLWRPEQAEQHRQVRIELVEFLLSHGERARALSELLLLAANLPEDAAVQVQAGRLFLAADDPRRALDQFAHALRLDPGNERASAGAGESAFALGDYAKATRFLKAAPPDDTRARELRDLAQLVSADDPLAPRLRATERRTRSQALVQQATARLDGCLDEPAADARPALESLRREARAFASPPEATSRPGGAVSDAEDAIDLAYRIERAAERGCRTPPALRDRAIVLIGRKHGLEEP